ncbi:DUF6199 family natural product biosynthesis protein [Proteiniclasticum sp.]|uniref:DUF6199 family natural product biosynthesis protein n=1 Tax=Proteiniclasticum sp. TaxID=2053595 RepID=UPI00289EB189|nr:DUF6199 family natural product biosynthesis protein [Proteiniclasticum sp.]
MNDGITIAVTVFFGFSFLLGLINFINPRFLWRTFQKWKATEVPSKSYFMFQRFAGLIAMLIIGYFFLIPYIGSRM